MSTPIVPPLRFGAYLQSLRKSFEGAKEILSLSSSDLFLFLFHHFIVTTHSIEPSTIYLKFINRMKRGHN